MPFTTFLSSENQNCNCTWAIQLVTKWVKNTPEEMCYWLSWNFHTGWISRTNPGLAINASSVASIIPIGLLAAMIALTQEEKSSI